jgi:hypothetical protein
MLQQFFMKGRLKESCTNDEMLLVLESVTCLLIVLHITFNSSSVPWW